MALYNEDYDKANLKVLRCNNIMRNLNWITSATLIFGIISLVLFCSFNAIKMAKEKQHVPAPVILPEKQIGRTITPPQPPPTKNVGEGNSNTNK
jgi:hypothetical protein